MSCGEGAHGPRLYDWAWLPIRRQFEHGRRGWVLARCCISDPTEIAYYVCFGKRGTRLRELVRVAGARWAVEESFQTAKNEVGVDNYQVRRYDGWYAHITLAMLAAAFLAATRAAQAAKGRRCRGRHAHPSQQQPDPTPLQQACPHRTDHRRTGAVLVDLATPPTGPSQSLYWSELGRCC